MHIMVQSLVIEKVVPAMYSRGIEKLISKEGPECQNLWIYQLLIRKRVYDTGKDRQAECQ